MKNSPEDVQGGTWIPASVEVTWEISLAAKAQVDSWVRGSTVGGRTAAGRCEKRKLLSGANLKDR